VADIQTIQAALGNTGATSASPVAPSGPTEQSLGQQDFLELMVAQLQNQDPFQPMENGDFIAQMAQFSTVDGISELNTSMDSLVSSFGSNQLLDAASLIGREVLSMRGAYSGSARTAAVDLPNGGPLQVRIQSADGSLAQVLDLGSRSAGMVDVNLPELPPGNYQVQAVLGSGAASQTLDVLMADRIQGVTLAAGGGQAQLQLANGQELALSDVRHIRQEN
jgi:flagellar basal-body rod modification protein FlgD